MPAACLIVNEYEIDRRQRRARSAAIAWTNIHLRAKNPSVESAFGMRLEIESSNQLFSAWMHLHSRVAYIVSPPTTLRTDVEIAALDAVGKRKILRDVIVDTFEESWSQRVQSQLRY